MLAQNENTAGMDRDPCGKAPFGGRRLAPVDTELEQLTAERSRRFGVRSRYSLG